MSPIYYLAAGGAILYLLTKKAGAQRPPMLPSEEVPLAPEEGGDVVVPEPEVLPVGTTAWLKYSVQTPAGFINHFVKDELSWNGRKSSGTKIAGTSFSSLERIKADGRFQVIQVTLPPGSFGY